MADRNVEQRAEQSHEIGGMSSVRAAMSSNRDRMRGV